VIELAQFALALISMLSPRDVIVYTPPPAQQKKNNAGIVVVSCHTLYFTQHG
jgi:hypothetical protein